MVSVQHLIDQARHWSDRLPGHSREFEQNRRLPVEIASQFAQAGFFHMLALGVSAVSLGIGYHALEAFKDLAGVKKPTGSRKTLIERHSVQADVARSIADLRSAESFIKEVIDEAWRSPMRIWTGHRVPGAQGTWANLKAAREQADLSG